MARYLCNWMMKLVKSLVLQKKSMEEFNLRKIFSSWQQLKQMTLGWRNTWLRIQWWLWQCKQLPVLHISIPWAQSQEQSLNIARCTSSPQNKRYNFDLLKFYRENILVNSTSMFSIHLSTPPKQRRPDEFNTGNIAAIF